jgi:hypothetical protein
MFTIVGNGALHRKRAARRVAGSSFHYIDNLVFFF